MATVTAVRERPILFNGEMVRAILEGRKTQTRRVMKPHPTWVPYPDHVLEPGCDAGFWSWFRTPRDHRTVGPNGPWGDFLDVSPYGQPGDRLWVRETHTFVAEPILASVPGVAYQADNSVRWLKSLPDGMRCFNVVKPEVWKWRPSIHMPRWASRITLEVTDMRVERVQEITRDDIAAEGVVLWSAVDKRSRHEDREAFARLWDQINGPRGFGWDMDPWVWVIGFRPLTTTDAESEHD